MQTATQYLAGTESAVRHLFTGIDIYLKLIRIATTPVFATSEPHGPAQDAEYEVWQIKNRESLEAARQAEKKFIAEYSALDALCGAILQIADKTLSLYGKDASIPLEWQDVVKPGKKGTAKYWRGRLVREVPLGLVIHAARNQHAHFDDPKPHTLTVRVFGFLATAHGYPTSAPDRMYDLANLSLTSFASNVTGLMKWRTYDQYENDMRPLLEI